MTTLYSKVSGSGPVIILLHGNSQSHRVWNTVIAQDALHGYTLVTPDLPGQGQSFRSEHPEQDYNLRSMAGHLVDFCRQFEQQGYLLVASSLATNLVAERAHSFTNCKGIMLNGACIIGENIMVDEIVKPNPNFPLIFAHSATDAELNALMNDEAYVVSPQLNQQLKDMYRDTDPNLRLQLGECINNEQYSDEIGNLWHQNIPIAIVYGVDDALINPHYMDNLNLKLWRQKIIKLPRTGHCIQFDEPEILARLIAEFAGDCFK